MVTERTENAGCSFRHACSCEETPGTTREPLHRTKLKKRHKMWHVLETCIVGCHIIKSRGYTNHTLHLDFKSAWQISSTRMWRLLLSPTRMCDTLYTFQLLVSTYRHILMYLRALSFKTYVSLIRKSLGAWGIRNFKFPIKPFLKKKITLKFHTQTIKAISRYPASFLVNQKIIQVKFEEKLY